MKPTIRQTFLRGLRGLPLLAAVGLLLLLSACAPGLVPGGAPTAGEIPALEERLRIEPDDRDARLRLGAAYLGTERPVEARRVLAPMTDAEDVPRPTALVLLGSAFEAEGDHGNAREAYQRYLEIAEDGAQRRQVRGRLALVRRLELESDVRAALEGEAELAEAATDSGTVAVFPFVYDGTDPEYRPLGRALAEMVVTDLSRIERVRVLERLRVQLLLDELALAESDRVDPGTAARSGRMLGAGRVVQGRIGGDEALVSVVAGLVATDQGAQMASLEESDPIDAFFDLQKRLVLSLFETMGVQLSPAEREVVLDRPTENLRALLLYGEALEAQDQGDFPRAAELFGEAAEEDPDFEEANDGAELSRELERTREISPQAFAMEGMGPGAPGTTPGSVLAEIQVGVQPIEHLVPGPEGRDSSVELLGTEGLGTGTILQILLRRP